MNTAYEKYYRAYYNKRYSERRIKVFELLGGKCCECGGVEHLQIDHIDPSQKSFTVTSRLWHQSWDKIENELKKCQLLCAPCHTQKTIKDSGKKAAKGTHGTLSSYRYCKCESCRMAKREWTRKYRMKKARLA